MQGYCIGVFDDSYRDEHVSSEIQFTIVEVVKI